MKYLIVPILTASLLICSCGGKGGPKAPEAAMLIFPEENSECTSGQSLSDSQSSVVFRWNQASHADSYQLTVTRLSTGSVDNYNTSATSFAVSLQKGEPYSWYITSISEKVADKPARSATWRFYNAGDGVENYVPFPAELIYPSSGATVNATNGTLNLRWSGADIDNDIDMYQVYLSTSNPPTSLIGTNAVGLENMNAQSLASGSVYYWQVYTHDSAGNVSKSEVSQFRVR